MSHGSIPLPGPSAELSVHFTSLLPLPLTKSYLSSTEIVQLSGNSRRCYSSHGGFRNVYRHYCCRALGATLLDGSKRRHVQAMLLLLPSSISNFTSLRLTRLFHFISSFFTTFSSCMSARLLDAPPLIKQVLRERSLLGAPFNNARRPPHLHFAVCNLCRPPPTSHFDKHQCKH